ncbi:MAG: mandelate racemase/muconate lactonizing enzyme family protein [Chloroflexi bacterium]|nr:mandelate racemase/muconate lactonizing enzyme family protein [Chloroflexota bacterium]
MTPRKVFGPTTRIAAVEAFAIVGDKDYVGGAGLKPPAGTAPQQRRAIAEIGDRHICVYPPQAQSCLVKITAEDGTVGWGEGHAPLGPRATAAVVTDVLAPLLIGEDPLAIEAHWERMYGSMRLRGHVAGYQLEAMAGVDIALWDLAGKLTGLPVYRLLGGPFATDLPCYASGVPGRTVEERAASAERFIAEGYTAMKASIGRGNLDEDLAAVAALVETVAGRADVLVDAHGAYASHSALFVGRELQRMGVRWLEDPLPPEDVEGYVALSAALEMPVAAGETECTRWQFEERLRQKAVDLILPDICRAGGISEGRKIALVADLHNVRWAAHVSMGTSVHVAAAAHLAAASANFFIFEFSSTPNPIGDVLLTGPLHPVGGALRVPDGPGLGITFDEAKLRQHLL